MAGTGFYSPDVVGKPGCAAGNPVSLVREPANPHDASAIAVFVTVRRLGFFSASVQVGHLKADLAKRLAPLMDSGKPVRASIASVFAPPGRQHPRVSLNITY